LQPGRALERAHLVVLARLADLDHRDLGIVRRGLDRLAATAPPTAPPSRSRPGGRRLTLVGGRLASFLVVLLGVVVLLVVPATLSATLVATGVPTADAGVSRLLPGVGPGVAVLVAAAFVTACRHRIRCGDLLLTLVGGCAGRARLGGGALVPASASASPSPATTGLLTLTRAHVGDGRVAHILGIVGRVQFWRLEKDGGWLEG